MVQLTHDLTITAVAPDAEDAVREWFDLERAAWRADRPHDRRRARCTITPSSAHRGRDTNHRLARPLPRRRRRRRVAVGATAGQPRQRDGRSRRPSGPAAPGHRSPAAHPLADAARPAGRIRLLGEAAEPLDTSGAGAGFLLAAGAHKALAARRRRLTLPPDDAELTRLGAAARDAATGYDVVRWTEDTPEP